MNRTVHRPCAICASGHFKCNPGSETKTCSDECSSVYKRNGVTFRKMERGWHRVNDVPAFKNAPVVRVGNTLSLRMRN